MKKTYNVPKGTIDKRAPKTVTLKFKLERFCEMNGRGRDGVVIRFELPEVLLPQARALKKAFRGSGIYAVSVK
jgi:hypothetical protein